MKKRSFRIMEALSGVDEELLVRCDGQQFQEQDSGQSLACHHGHRQGSRAVRGRGKAMPLWRYAGTWAAVVCLAAAGAASWGGYRLITETRYDASGSSGGSADNQAHSDVQQEMLQAPQKEPGMENAKEDLETKNTYPEEGEAGEDQAGAGEDQAWNSGDIDGCGTAQTDGAAMEKEHEAAEMEKDTAADVSGMLAAKSLTREETLEIEGLSAYMPQSVPEGYVFREAFYYPDTEGNLTVVWDRGTDSITWNIREEEDFVSIVDADRTEVYDMSLYEVPYEETVPEEYWGVFRDPVFAFGDLDLEVVRSRMASGSDAGDSDTPWGCFGVLYPEGVLVRFEGNGTAEEIWEMFCTVE